VVIGILDDGIYNLSTDITAQFRSDLSASFYILLYRYKKRNRNRKRERGRIFVFGDYLPNFFSLICFIMLADPSFIPTCTSSGSCPNHGTSCAAIAAAIANNSYCGVGVAFGAQTASLKVLGNNANEV
jgi:subtilisin family serine protease